MVHGDVLHQRNDVGECLMKANDSEFVGSMLRRRIPWRMAWAVSCATMSRDRQVKTRSPSPPAGQSPAAIQSRVKPPWIAALRSQ